MRQYFVTHLATGQITLVMAKEYDSEAAARHAGHRYPADCTVTIVKRGFEIPLPFDELPLIICRAA